MPLWHKNDGELEKIEKQRPKKALCLPICLKVRYQFPFVKMPSSPLSYQEGQDKRMPASHQPRNLHTNLTETILTFDRLPPCIYLPTGFAPKSLTLFPLSCRFSTNALFFVKVVYKFSGLTASLRFSLLSGKLPVPCKYPGIN